MNLIHCNHKLVGDKVSSNIGNSVTLIDNPPANNLPIISDDMKKNDG